MKFKKPYFIFLTIFLIINILICNYSYGANFNVKSPSVILFNTNTGKIVYEKNAYEKRYPASTTKMMAAILTLENCNLNDTVTITNTALALPVGYDGFGLQEGEILTVDQLLHLMLIASSNESANALAEHIAGSTSKFVVMMNNKAKEIGCANTNFVNPVGIHNDNHYSTAHDLLLIANYAMQKDTFRKIVSISSYTLPATNKSPERTVMNTNKLLNTHNEKTHTENIYYYEYATGIKTGYTTYAKNCLVASAKKNGVEYFLVILSASDNEVDNNSQRFSDAKGLFEAAFDNYSLSTIKKAGDLVTSVKIPNAIFFKKNLNLLLENDIELLMENEDLKLEITPEVKLYEDKLVAPISKGDILGTVTYIYDRNILY